MQTTNTPAVEAATLRDGELDSPLTVRLSSDHRSRLRRYAERHGISTSDVVRLAIAQFLAQSLVHRKRRTPRDSDR